VSGSPARVRAALAAAIVVVAVFTLLTVAMAVTRGSASVTLEEQVRDFTRQLTPRGPYRPPSADERAVVLDAVAALIAAGPAAPGADGPRGELERSGLTTEVLADREGRRYLVARSDPGSERAWGLLALPLDGPARMIVEVPHPNSDYGTEEVGLAVLGVVPHAIYLQAGAHRRAADEQADVAHREDSLFHALAVDLSVRLRLPQLQLHGFAERAERDEDVVLSAGPVAPGPAVRDLADRLEEAGVTVCRAWSRRCHGLEGTTNVQAEAAARAGLPFAHVELSPSMRRRPSSVAEALATLAG
jgi:hypothetical protein